MDFISNIGNKRNSRKTNSRRPYTRRTSISSLSSGVNIAVATTNNTTTAAATTSNKTVANKKKETLYSLNNLDAFPNYKPQQHQPGNSQHLRSDQDGKLNQKKLFFYFIIVKPEKLWIDTEHYPSSTEEEEVEEEEEDLFTEVAVSSYCHKIITHRRRGERD